MNKLIKLTLTIQILLTTILIVPGKTLAQNQTTYTFNLSGQPHPATAQETLFVTFEDNNNDIIWQLEYSHDDTSGNLITHKASLSQPIPNSITTAQKIKFCLQQYSPNFKNVGHEQCTTQNLPNNWYNTNLIFNFERKNITNVSTEALNDTVPNPTLIGDLAEFMFSQYEIQSGEIVTIDRNLSQAVKKTDKPYDPAMIGVISSDPTILLNKLLAGQKREFHPPVALQGRTYVQVSNINGPIHTGDPITSSSIPGVGMKSTGPGFILGKALENFNGSNAETCKHSPQYQCGKIIVFLGTTWYDPDTSITQTGQIYIDYNISESIMAGLGYSGSKNEIETATYRLTDSLGNTISRIGQFSQLAAAKIQTGLLSARNIVTQNIISDTSISKKTKTSIISPLSDLSDTIVIDGKTKINNDLTVQGNTAISGSLSATNASITGTLYVDNLISRDGSITEVMASKISSLRDEIKNLISSDSTPSGIPTSPLLAESENWSSYISSESAQINGSLSLSNNLVVGAKLTVLGDTQLGNAFIAGTFAAGEVAIRDNFIETTNTALYIQPSGLGSIHLMSDTLVIADNGQVIINGNLHLNGDLTAQNASFTGSLIGNLLQASEASISGTLLAGNVATGEISADKINIATESATTIIAESGFAQLATSSAQLATNATAGTSTLPAGKTEIVIYNQKVTSSSIVYLTPAGSTDNQVPYIKTKFISPTPTPEGSSTDSQSYFTIALDQPLQSDLSINWWIIN